MSRHYYILVDREGPGSPWTVQFGDYERSVVMGEYRDHRDHDVRASDLRVVMVDGDTQADIDAEVRLINGEQR